MRRPWARSADGRSYNRFAELASQSASFAGNSLYHVSFDVRDKLGRIVQKTETIQGSTSTTAYAYDAAGRLETVSIDGSTVSTYSYDANGNRLSHNDATASYDAQDRLLRYGDVSYAYTANGQLQSRTEAGATTTYAYDLLGNLRNVSLPGDVELEYLIDGRNRRIGKKVNGSLVQGFVYQDQLNPVAELDASGTLVSRFVYADKANVPAYMIKNGDTYRIISDHLGSVRLVLNSSDGSVAQRIDYDEFGHVTRDTNPGFQPFGFAGGIYDLNTELVRFGARDYDPVTGRWTAKDPIGFAGGDANVYGYVSNDPVNLIDPTGLEGFGGHSYGQMQAIATTQAANNLANQAAAATAPQAAVATLNGLSAVTGAASIVFPPAGVASTGLSAAAIALNASIGNPPTALDVIAPLLSAGGAQRLATAVSGSNEIGQAARVGAAALDSANSALGAAQSYVGAMQCN